MKQKADPFVIGSCDTTLPRFLMKSELIYNPVGIVFWIFYHIPINRSFHFLGVSSFPYIFLEEVERELFGESKQPQALFRKKMERFIVSFSLCYFISMIYISLQIAIFVEGKRSKSGEMGEFKKGAFYMACECGIPIRPMLIQNAFELLSPGSIFCRQGRVMFFIFFCSF